MRNKKNPDIDLALSVVDVITPEGYTWSDEDLAEVCGCSKQYISQIANDGLKKLRARSILQPYRDGI